MAEKFSTNRSGKRVFVVESDETRRQEIRDALSHQSTWDLFFFPNPDACMNENGKGPMAIFLDIEHFSHQSTDSQALLAISDLRDRFPDSEVIVFCDSIKEHQAAALLRSGAMDYIVLNQHQYLRMESELNWLAKVLDQRAEDRRQKLYLLLMSIGMLLFILTLIILDYLGIIKEGTSPDILIGE